MKYIILMSGKINSGKNFFAEKLTKEFEEKGMKVEHDLFAKDLKNGAKEDFSIVTDYLNSFAEKLKSSVNVLFDTAKYEANPLGTQLDDLIDELKTVDENWYEDKTELTRLVLQLYGTEIFRNRVDTDHWAKQVMNRAIASDADVYIATDTRFPNEISVFSDVVDSDVQVLPIRIERPVDTKSNIAEHSSETSLDDWTEWSYIINNTGTIEDLEESATLIAEDVVIPIERTSLFESTEFVLKQIKNK